MIAAELLSGSIPPLKASDTVKDALNRMSEFKLSHLPVVDNGLFLGLVTEDELIEIRDVTALVGSLSLSLLNSFVYENAHIYEVIRLFSQLRLSAVPVVSAAKDFLGLISINAILEYAASIYSATEPGGIIVLEIGNRDNSLAQIAQIVESENAQILSSYIQSFPDSTRLEITLKTNKTEVAGIVAAFERYNYQVKSVYNVRSENSDNEDRYNSLMNYLNV